MLDLPLPILRHRALEDPMVVHQVRLLCGAEAAHLRQGGAWERSAEAARPRLYYPLASLTCLRGTPLHWWLTFCPLASSITQTSLQVCVWCSRELCAVLGCACGCDG